MIPQHKQSEAHRSQLLRQVPYSTDPQRLRDMAGEEQFSKAFVIVAALVGALAFYGVFAAIASI